MITLIHILCEGKDKSHDYSGLGGALGKTLSTAAVPIPGSGFIFGPPMSAAGEVIGSMIPKTKGKDSKFIQRIESSYNSGGKYNLQFDPRSQMLAAKKRAEHSGKHGGNNVSKTLVGIDPIFAGIT